MHCIKNVSIYDQYSRKVFIVSLQNTYSFMLNLGIPFSRTENIGYMIFRKRVWQKIQFRMQRCDFRTRCCGISNTCFSLWACLHGFHR